MIRLRHWHVIGFVLLLSSFLTHGLSQDLLASAVNAPVSPDGTVTGKATDFVINFNTSMDPAVAGRTLLAGKTITVILPEAFTQKDPPVPIVSVGTDDCAPPLVGQCNTAGLLQGWPQKPIPFGLYPLSFEEPNTFVFTAVEDVFGDAGIKQIHFLTLGFVNPAPGTYEIQVLAETGPNGSLETGAVTLEILPQAVAHIGVTSALSEAPGTNLIYQTTSVGAETPLPFDFLIWDQGGVPLTGVVISDDSSKLMQGDREVGLVSIEAPEGATGQRAFSSDASTERNSPVIAKPTAHLRVHFLTGSEAGLYQVTFSLHDGDSVVMVVQAN